MPRFATTILLTLFVGATPTQAHAVSPTETDPQAIMDAVEAIDAPDKVRSRIAMKVMDGAGRERTRVVQSIAMNFNEGSKQLMLFEEPADVRNTGLLSIDYDDGGQDDDQWLYLPSLKKSTRISSSGKSGSFMGTDLSYSDMTKQDPTHYDYEIVEQSAKVAGEECWLIESRPKTAKAKKETGYIKSHVWVSKAKLTALQIKSWVRKGKKLKYIQFADIKKIGGVWTPHKIMAQTKRGSKVESKTLILFKEYAVNQADVTEARFTQRQLEQGL
ncbi:MAG: outer membrane lipoprotein-sorting protein [Deltaproteobacteria bacterium]|nr:outer membrane lipoprotein-sorting protein [Deltaproteobacteria bacterium]